MTFDQSPCRTIDGGMRVEMKPVNDSSGDGSQISFTLLLQQQPVIMPGWEHRMTGHMTTILLNLLNQVNFSCDPE